jgi:hypothetical protein
MLRHVRNPVATAVSWWARVTTVRAVDAELKASGFVHGSMDAGEAIRLASQLVHEGVDEAVAVESLRAMRGGRKALQNAAQMLARYANNGYPLGPMYRLLRAAYGEPVAPLSSEEIVAEARERQLKMQPLSTSFAELAELVPGLRDLEQRVRTNPAELIRDLPPAVIARFGGTLPRLDSEAGQMLTLHVVREAVQQLVGPSSGQPNPVLASSAASDVANQYLAKLTGIDPQTWPNRGRP